MIFLTNNIKFREAATRGVLWIKVFLEILQNSHENTYARVSFLIKLQTLDLQLYSKETLVQVFSCEFFEIFKNTFPYRTPLVAASVITRKRSFISALSVCITVPNHPKFLITNSEEVYY